MVPHPTGATFRWIFTTCKIEHLILTCTKNGVVTLAVFSSWLIW
jgi:hypothetical protein